MTQKLKLIARHILAGAMTFVGILHFVRPEPFVAIVPSILPSPLLLVYVSGVFEIAGGLGLLLPKTRVAAAWGLVLLYIAVFPANINMAVNNIPLDGVVNPVAAWVRLPFQALFIAWAWWMTRPDAPSESAPENRKITS